jgi:phenylalanyl-tRNA synthetase alpha chain
MDDHSSHSLSDEIQGLISMPLESLEKVGELRRRWLGKEGTLKEALKNLRNLPPEERVSVASQLNDLQTTLDAFLESEDERLRGDAQAKALEQEYVDLSLPGTHRARGGIHPVTKVERTIQRILASCGFSVLSGPELETEYYCFDALNIPKHHPARDLQDTFFTESGKVLRTHTTSVQSRVLETKQIPLKVASMGRVFRNESEDASHRAMFHQLELIWLEKQIGLSHLTGLITYILKELYGKQKRIRFVSKYYPYTEPSIGAQIDAGGDEWTTVGGAGVIHPAVLREFGYDPSQVQGVAFGLGTSRLVAEFFSMGHLRDVYANDLRVLKGLIA